MENLLEAKSNCNVEDLTSKILGDFGKWQFGISISMCLLKLPLAWYQLNIIFMAPPQDFWCVKPKFLTKYSDTEWREICAPKTEEHPCLIFDPDLLFVTPAIDRYLIPLVRCKEFVYDTSVFKRTITSDWNLVCDKHWLVHLTQFVMMWGVLIGSIIFGILADSCGRKWPLRIAITLQCVSSYIISVIQSYTLFLVAWFILAVASGGIGIISFVVCMEVVGGKWRTIIPILYQLPFGLGNTLMACLAYWLRDWRKLEFALASLSALYLLYWLNIPESPRWMLATGRIDEAMDVLKAAATKNKKERYYEQYKHLLSRCKGQSHSGPGFMGFIKSKHMRLNTLLLSVNWFCTGLSFFTFSQYLGLIGANIFLTVAISGLISVLGSVLCLVVVTKFDRKSTVWLFQLITGLCFLFILFIPKDRYSNDWPRLVLASIGFAGLSGTVPALYLFTGELFPTIGRNAGVGGVTTFARIAAMVAPAVVSLDDIKPDLPLILLALTSFAQMVLLGPLPETKDLPLFDTIDQLEEFFNSKTKVIVIKKYKLDTRN